MLENLDLLAEVAGRVTLFGEERDVMKLDGGAYRALYALEADGNTDIRPLFDVAARLVPSLSREQLDQLQAKQVGRIIAIAGHTIATVEESFPNSAGPTENGNPAAQA